MGTCCCNCLPRGFGIKSGDDETDVQPDSLEEEKRQTEARGSPQLNRKPSSTETDIHPSRITYSDTFRASGLWNM
ncbi:hypothetical protein ILYODFUR_012825 [Ilyodon furcidens]|uniref:Uncharacterized protein n=1 Tax=Ilyodon furcidens TaxID=33524 RepID=A0ABV0VG89_9TELE